MKPRAEQVSADQALRRLIEGNQRFAAGQLRHSHLTPERRTEVAQDVWPFAAVLGCSDARVPVEMVFDQGLGDLFVIRVAGNVVGRAVLFSLEFASTLWSVPLVLVLGHTRCGAVSAVVDRVHELQAANRPWSGMPQASPSDAFAGHMPLLLETLWPAAIGSRHRSGDPVANAVEENVRMTVQRLKSSQPILSSLVTQGKLVVAGACYDVETGIVKILE